MLTHFSCIILLTGNSKSWDVMTTSSHHDQSSYEPWELELILSLGFSQFKELAGIAIIVHSLVSHSLMLDRQVLLLQKYGTNSKLFPKSTFSYSNFYISDSTLECSSDTYTTEFINDLI